MLHVATLDTDGGQTASQPLSVHEISWIFIPPAYPFEVTLPIPDTLYPEGHEDNGVRLPAVPMAVDPERQTKLFKSS
jgi:hypothetical protein